MQVRWGRVAGAAGAALAALPVALLGGLWATASAPGPAPRQHPGPEACRTVDRMEAAWAEPSTQRARSTNEVAARAFLAAARCGTQARVPAAQTLVAHRAALRAVAWVEAEREGEAAARDLLDLWALASDAQETSSSFDALGWSTVAEGAAEALSRVLADPATQLEPAARAEAQARLTALARHTPDLRRRSARDEEEIWGMIGAAVADPRGWPSLWAAPGLLWEARRGAGPSAADQAADAATARLDAAVLAAELALWDGCPQAAPDLDPLQSEGVLLAYDPSRCAVGGASPRRVRVAVPHGGGADAG